MTTAIVLSGGGARGDFQLGALRYLYDSGIVPNILCGTSVGALNAVKLAEGEDPNNPQQGLAGLEMIWDRLRVNGDMFAEEGWLYDQDMDSRIRNLLTGRSTELGIAPPEDRSQWGSELGWVFQKLTDLGWLLSDGQSLIKSFQVFITKARSLYNLNPISQKLSTLLDVNKVEQWANAGGRLRLAAVSLETGRLRYITETGAVIERDGTTAVRDYESIPAACQQLAGEVASLEIEIKNLQAELKDAAPGQKSRLAGLIGKHQADLRTARDQYATCLATNPAGPLAVSLKAGALASASIPGVFPPIALGTEFYVDGGVREVLPLQIAADLGADTIYAIEASQPELPTSTHSFRRSGVADIVSRSLTEIAINEINRDDRRQPIESGRTVTVVSIHPEQDLHGITTIDPGLIKIASDYGYMRAADALDSGAAAERVSLATEIALLRRTIWAMENQRWGKEDPTRPAEPAPTEPNPSLQAVIDQEKNTLQQKVDRRRALGGPMPADIDLWSGRLEPHAWGVSVNSAQYLAQAPPQSGGAPGRLMQVSVTMRNTGTTTWKPDDHYALGSQDPQDNAFWGGSRVPLPGPVEPGRQVVFAWTATVPNPPAAQFAWRMVQDGVEWFGDTTPSVTVQISEPSECASLRLAIQQAQLKYERQQAAKRVLNPRDPVDMREIMKHAAAMKEAQRIITASRTRAEEIRCGPVP